MQHLQKGYHANNNDRPCRMQITRFINSEYHQQIIMTKYNRFNIWVLYVFSIFHFTESCSVHAIILLISIITKKTILLRIKAMYQTYKLKILQKPSIGFSLDSRYFDSLLQLYHNYSPSICISVDDEQYLYVLHETSSQMYY